MVRGELENDARGCDSGDGSVREVDLAGGARADCRCRASPCARPLGVFCEGQERHRRELTHTMMDRTVPALTIHHFYKEPLC